MRPSSSFPALSLLAIGALACAPARNGPVPEARPSAAIASVPAHRLAADTAARIDSIFARFSPTTPGCALNLLRDGASIYAKGYGLASLELGVPISTKTVFDIGSTSKQFTAAAVALLAIDGKLSLDDDIRTLVPELPDLGAIVTLRHLLTHTSGWRDYIDLMVIDGWDDRDHTTDREALDVLRRQRALNFAPGTDFRYSNTGYFLMSVVVQRASGKSLAEFARERLFAPLGMRDTRFLTDSREVIAHKAMAYEPAGAGRFLIAMSDWEQVGDGAVQTSAEDLARWDANFDSGIVGGRALLELLQTPARQRDGTPLQYGLGLSLDEQYGLRRVSHGGAWAGFRAMTMRFPTRRLSLITLCNRADGNPSQLASAVAGVFLGPATPALAGDTRTTPPMTDPPARLAGIYFADATGQIVRLDTLQRHLVLLGATPVRLEPVASDRFRHPSSGAEWRFEEDGESRRLTITGAGGRPMVLQRVPPTPSTLSLPEYVGRYHSPELAAEFEIVLRNDGLHVHRHRGEDVPLRPLFRDAFGGPVLVRFQRDGNGRVQGLTLTSRGVQALAMTRR